MFDITNDEKLRDAYALLMFMQKDVPASSKKKANVKNLAATVKREIRSYNNRPASNVRIISGDYNGHLDLVRLPDELDRMHEEAAADWFRGNCYLEAYNSQYDCTGQEFTNWFYLFRRHGHWFAGMSEEVERMAKYTIDAVLEVWGSFDVEADSFGEAYRKAAENPGKYANLKVWNDGAEAQLRTYNRINCVGEYDIDDAVAALAGKEVKKE